MLDICWRTLVWDHIILTLRLNHVFTCQKLKFWKISCTSPMRENKSTWFYLNGVLIDQSWAWSWLGLLIVWGWLTALGSRDVRGVNADLHPWGEHLGVSCSDLSMPLLSWLLHCVYLALLVNVLSVYLFDVRTSKETHWLSIISWLKANQISSFFGISFEWMLDFSQRGVLNHIFPLLNAMFDSPKIIINVQPAICQQFDLFDLKLSDQLHIYLLTDH